MNNVLFLTRTINTRFAAMLLQRVKISSTDYIDLLR